MNRGARNGSFHGRKAGRLVAVGPVDLPVTRLVVEEIILECRRQRITRMDILGFELVACIRASQVPS